MNDKDRIIQTIYSAIDDLNQQQAEDLRLEKNPNTTLFGQEGKLDSLGLVNLIVASEQKVEENFGLPISIADERAMSQKNSPFRTVESLADYIAILLSEKSNA
jgi:acyl carrier protein